MTTRAQVAQLWALQQVDSEIERAEAERDALRATLANDAAQAARASLAQAQRATQARERRLREAEDMLDETRQRRLRQEQRLYAGSVPAKDLEKLQREIEHLRGMQATQEETVLTAMEAVEVAQKATASRQRTLDEAEETQAKARSRAAEQLTGAEERCVTLGQRRAERAAACDAGLLARYETLRRGHGGRAVAEVRDETHDGVRAHVCQGCRVKLTDAAYSRARSAAELPLCPNCGRILYVP